jgi:transposase
MATVAVEDMEVTVGVDTHKELHVAAAFDALGRLLGTREFETSAAGYRALEAWARGFGRVRRAGVEGTSSWGAGLARSLRQSGIEVVEVARPNRQRRRQRGKSDTADAIAAGRAVLAGDATAVAKAGDGAVEALRLVRIARRSADRARTQTVNQLRAVIDTAPEELRAELRALSLAALVARATQYAVEDTLVTPLAAARYALRTLALRFVALDGERDALDAQIATLVTLAAPPQLLEEFGVGPQTAMALLITAGDNPERLKSDAAFAALCGVSPIDASSGKQERHRLNRGGDRQANHAVWRIVMVRLRHDPRTKAYVARRISEGKTKREAVRCLKRYVARRIWRLLAGCVATEQAA